MADDLTIDRASEIVSGAPRTSTLAEVRESLGNVHAEHPQRAQLAHHALDQIEAGLHQLAALGHRFWLSPANPSPQQDWPKMLYKNGEPDRTVNNQADWDAAIADGWRDHPDADYQPEAVDGVEEDPTITDYDSGPMDGPSPAGTERSLVGDPGAISTAPSAPPSPTSEAPTISIRPKSGEAGLQAPKPKGAEEENK